MKKIYNEKSDNEGGAVTAKQPFKEKLENFWYHYKWHSIVSAFLIVTLLVCSLQMCRRASYDIHITYAGYYEIERTGSGGSSPYNEALVSFGKLAEDFDGDGEVNITLQTLFIPSAAEKEMLLKADENLEINEALVKEDRDTLSTEIVYGDQYVFFLSRSLFDEYEKQFNGALFLPLDEYAKNNPDCKFVSDSKTGVRLDSLKIKKLPVLQDLPMDTVVCMRKLSEVSQVFGKAQNEENYRRGIEVIKNIFNYN